MLLIREVSRWMEKLPDSLHDERTGTKLKLLIIPNVMTGTGVTRRLLLLLESSPRLWDTGLTSESVKIKSFIVVLSF